MQDTQDRSKDSMQDIQDRVKGLVVKNLGVDANSVTSEARIAEDLGADSLSLAEITMDLEKEFDISIPQEDVEKIRTLSDAVQCIKTALQQKAPAR